MTAPERTLNAKQRSLVELHKISPTFDLEAALKEFESKPRGRQPKPKPTVEVTETVDSIYREGRILLEHLESYVPLVRKICGHCGRAFLVNYRSCSFCSDVCRAISLHEKYGITWNPDNTETNRWQYWKVPPSTIRPETLRRLEAFARSILGIEPTEEDLALAKEADSHRINANRGPERLPDGVREEGNPVVGEPGVGVAANSGAITNPAPVLGTPAPMSTDKMTVVAGIRAKFAAGEITAHELQVQLTAALRG